ncbi:MAG: hypothetical protein JJE46_04520, partial [Acidimicrobiia bacterium]|nr:hypothetical protein [Acidimicrobiia bacterium]
MTAAVPDVDPESVAEPDEVPRHVIRRGLRVLWRFVKLNPLPFSIAIVGAIVYAGASVLGTLVLGRVTDKVLTPSFNSTGVSHATTWNWVALI